MTAILTRDDIRPPADWDRSPLGLYLPPKGRTRYDLPVAVDLFAGAGGFGMGMHQAGFHVAAASEVWATAAATYMVNLARPGVKIHFDSPERERDFEQMLTRSFRLDDKARKKKQRKGVVTGDGDWDQCGPISVAGSGWISGQPPHVRGCEQFFLYDIRSLTGELILDALGMEVGEVAVITGGPPCQGYSVAGKRDVMDPRNSLVFEFARLVCEIQPRTFVMENVPGLLNMVTPEGIPVLDAFCHAVADGGYAEYDSLRRALGATEGARGVVRGRPDTKSKKRRGKPARPTPAADVEEQLDLLGALT